MAAWALAAGACAEGLGFSHGDVDMPGAGGGGAPLPSEPPAVPQPPVPGQVPTQPGQGVGGQPADGPLFLGVVFDPFAQCAAAEALTSLSSDTPEVELFEVTAPGNHDATSWVCGGTPVVGYSRLYAFRVHLIADEPLSVYAELYQEFSSGIAVAIVQSCGGAEQSCLASAKNGLVSYWAGVTYTPAASGEHYIYVQEFSDTPFATSVAPDYYLSIWYENLLPEEE